MKDLVLPEVSNDLLEAFIEIQQPRSNFALENFVVGDCNGSPTREYSQIVEELRRAYGSIKRGLLEQQKLELERQRLLEEQDPIKNIEAEIKNLDIEEVQAAIVGKLREFDCLYKLWKKYPKYTHQQLEDGELDYWTTRLQTQAARDLIAARIGISVSSQHGMERAKLTPVPKLHDLIPPVALKPPELNKEPELLLEKKN